MPSGCSRVAVKVTVMESTAWVSAFVRVATAGISSNDEQAARIPAAAANTAKLKILFLIMFTVLVPASAIVFFIVEITWRCVLQVATETVPFQGPGLRRAVWFFCYWRISVFHVEGFVALGFYKYSDSKWRIKENFV